MGGNAGSAGGNGGAGNMGGSAGSVSTGGTGNSGGAGGSTSTATCLTGATHPPSSMLITDFSDAVASTGGNFNFGSSKGQPGGTALYSSSGSSGTLSVVSGGLTFQGSVTAPTTSNMYPYSGFTVFVDGPACVNAAVYTGVSFVISGSGTCNVVFTFEDKEHVPTSADSMRGACTGMCYAGVFSIAVSSSLTTMKMPFSATPTTPGSPATLVDSMNLTGVQWQLGQASTATSACSETLTITNVSFY
jgi:hypothetical protein